MDDHHHDADDDAQWDNQNYQRYAIAGYCAYLSNLLSFVGGRTWGQYVGACQWTQFCSRIVFEHWSRIARQRQGLFDMGGARRP